MGATALPQIDADLALLQRLAGSRAAAATLRAASRVLAKRGMQDAALLVLERADEILDGVADEAVRA